MTKNLSYIVAVAALTAAAACGGTHEAVEQRPAGAANDRAAQVTNSTDTKEGPSDTVVTTKVQTKLLSDPLVKGRRINVQTKDGTVTLVGSVMSKAESDKAEELAKNTEDVKSVVNHLMVETKR
jgi:osmotically-inducible protein OsmY